MRKKNFLFIIICFILITGVELIVFYFFARAVLGLAYDTGKAVKKKTINIKSGIPTKQIGELLAASEIIQSPLVFSFYARWEKLDGKLKAGIYDLNNRMSIPEILQRLTSGPPDSGYWVTIPEGLNVDQVVDLLWRKGYIDKVKFYNEVASGDFYYGFLAGLPQGKNRLEGYLFPDTYRITSTATEKEIINLMLQRFARELVELNYLACTRKAGFNLHQAVTIASMIELEAKVDNERPLIAGVILNRLRCGMPLQIDATVKYALGSNRSKIYYKDLEIDSPYNTYKINGLPLGPIASPGRASLLAVVNPAKTNYLYYVAKPDGTHVFACTLKEHNLNKKKYLR